MFPLKGIILKICNAMEMYPIPITRDERFETVEHSLSLNFGKSLFRSEPKTFLVCCRMLWLNLKILEWVGRRYWVGEIEKDIKINKSRAFIWLPE